MVIVEGFTQILQNIYNWFASFTDIGNMFSSLWNGFLGWFS